MAGPTLDLKSYGVLNVSHVTSPSSSTNRHAIGDLPSLPMYRMAAITPLYSPPDILRGEQCAKAPAGRRRTTCS
jgi:hypothetical protein